MTIIGMRPAGGARHGEGAASLEVVGMTKRFGPLAALDDVSIHFRAGSVHALLGENGAGKSTLVKCIMGYYRPDAGQIMLDKHEVAIGNPRDARDMGIGMVYQHFTLVPNMTVAENLVLSRPNVPAVLDWRKEKEGLEAFLATTPFHVDLNADIGALAAGERQKVEILRQLYLDDRFLILDEPTSVLTPGEADEVLGMLVGLAHQGRLTIVLISHKFHEVTTFCDDVSVLRRGRLAGGGSVKEMSTGDMARLMIGSAELPTAAKRGSPSAANGSRQPGLAVQGLQVFDDAGMPAVDGMDLAVLPGEIVGVAGVSGNGQRELVEVLAGQRDPDGGSVQVHGEPYGATRGEMTRHKMFCLPEEPLRNACVAAMTVAENLAFRTFDREPFTRSGWLRPSALRQAATDLIARFSIKTRSPESPIGTLSGGNVQRTVLARELSGDVDVLVTANPCFGLDFAATAEIRRRIVDARDRGAAVLLISEDLDELLEIADRIVVIFEGKFVYETPAGAADRHTIGRHMAGHGAAATATGH